ncbi:MAG TPA: hypothetical protein VK630_04500 [Reyranella sp.]|nr:hypothetical protein [Reyranella sp.]
MTDNAAQVSSIIDLANAQGCELCLIPGTDADVDAVFNVTIDEGDVANLSDAAPVAAGQLIGTLAQGSWTFADDNKPRKIGYNGTKRYIRATVTPVGNAGNLFLAGVAVVFMKIGPTANPPA